MALYEYAFGSFPRDGIWAITCQNGCRPEEVLSHAELIDLLQESLEMASDNDDLDEDEMQFLEEAFLELGSPVIVGRILEDHVDAFNASMDEEFGDMLDELDEHNTRAMVKEEADRLIQGIGARI